MFQHLLHNLMSIYLLYNESLIHSSIYIYILNLLNKKKKRNFTLTNFLRLLTFSFSNFFLHSITAHWLNCIHFFEIKYVFFLLSATEQPRTTEYRYNRMIKKISILSAIEEKRKGKIKVIIEKIYLFPRIKIYWRQWQWQHCNVKSATKVFLLVRYCCHGKT